MRLFFEIVGAWLLTGFTVGSLLYKFERKFSKDFPELLEGNLAFLLMGVLLWPIAVVGITSIQVIGRSSRYLSETNESIVTRWLRWLRGEPKPKKKIGIEA